MRAEDFLRYMGNVDDRYVEELFNESESAVVSIGRAPLRKRIIAIAVCLAVIVFGTCISIGLNSDTIRTVIDVKDNTQLIPMVHSTVIMIDVNPSLRLELDSDDTVVSAIALNDEAKEISSEFNVCGKNYKEAISDILRVMENEKYLTNLKNSVLITVLSPNESSAEAYRQSAVEVVNNFDNSLPYNISVLSQFMTDESDYLDSAISANISTGRVALLDKICKVTGGTVETLTSYSIQVINQALEYIGLPVGIERSGEVSLSLDDETQSLLGLAGMAVNEVIGFSSSLLDFAAQLGEDFIFDHSAYNIEVRQNKTNSGDTLWSLFAKDKTDGSKEEAATYSVNSDQNRSTGSSYQGSGLFSWVGNHKSGTSDNPHPTQEITDQSSGVTIKFKADQNN